MAIPSRAEAAVILRRQQPPGWLLAHSAAVAEVAAFLGQAIARRGVDLDTALVEAAALLHDVGKPSVAGEATHMGERLDHAAAGAALVERLGHGELAAAIAQHPVTVLGEAESYEAWAERAGLEGRIVAYADKRAAQDLVSLDERFEHWWRRHPGSELLRVARDRADRLEDELCSLAGVAPADVRRLAWASDALERAA